MVYTIVNQGSRICGEKYFKRYNPFDPNIDSLQGMKLSMELTDARNNETIAKSYGYEEIVIEGIPSDAIKYLLKSA